MYNFFAFAQSRSMDKKDILDGYRRLYQSEAKFVDKNLDYFIKRKEIELQDKFNFDKKQNDRD